MPSSQVTYQKVSIKYGILTGIAYIAYFLLMWALGVLEIIELSFISGIFLVIGICVGISRLKRAKDGNIKYFEGLGIGVTVGVVSSLILALFLVIFVSLVDTGYLAMLQASSFFPEGITKMALFGFTILYGTVPGLWIAFIAMQWFKRRDHSLSEGV